MKQYEFKERGGFAVTALELAFFIFGGAALASVGIGAVVFDVVCGCFVLAVTIHTCFQTRIISEAGITVRTILKTTFVPWADVERIGVAHLPGGPAWHWNLAVTCRTASGKKRDLLIPDTEALRAAVEEFYGELDFDQTRPSAAVPGRGSYPAEIGNPWRSERRVFGVMSGVMAVYGVVMGVCMESWMPVVVMCLFALVFVTVFAVDHPYMAMNGAGVTYRFLLCRRFLPWAGFQQAGVCLFENKKATGIVHKSYKLALLLPDGVPKKPGFRFRYYKNLGHVIYLPDTRENREFVIAHYGLLDFDESVDPRGYSIVVEE